MSVEKEKAASGKAAVDLNNTRLRTYHANHGPSTSKQARAIAKRLKEMPRSCRSLYDRAMTGKSRKAAMHSFCLECCGWQIKEVYLCTDPACPLFPYRPTSRVAQGASEGLPDGAESAKGVDYAL